MFFGKKTVFQIIGNKIFLTTYVFGQYVLKFNEKGEGCQIN